MDDLKVLEDILKSNVDFENDIVILSFNDGVGDLTKQFKRFILEMKMQVDRWDLVVDTIVFHTSVKAAVIDLLFKDIDVRNNEYSLWGAKIYFIDNVPQDNVFAFSLEGKNILEQEHDVKDNRYVSKGILPTKELQRVLNLKAFW